MLTKECQGDFMTDKTVSILNDLIETSKDGDKGFTKAATDAKGAELKTLFMEAARRCREGAQELQALVRMEGGDPDKSGSVAGAIHRGWVSLREAVPAVTTRRYWRSASVARITPRRNTGKRSSMNCPLPFAKSSTASIVA
jgi:hypothetical protein